MLLGALGVPVAFAVYWGSIAMRARPTALRPLSEAELRRAAASLPSNPSEQRYLGTLYELLSAAPALGQQPARDLLPQLNELLQNDRHLELQRERAQAAMGSRTPAELEAERADLARRTEAATDPVARQAMQQSLELCEERLRGIYALEPQLARIEAQRELISQTFASVQSALAGVQATSGAPAATGVERLGRTVLQINQQTRALEEAVQEVIALPQG
jgi:hypothetical protein